jgi:hypothetical protein
MVPGRVLIASIDRIVPPHEGAIFSREFRAFRQAAMRSKTDRFILRPPRRPAFALIAD